MNRLRSLLTAAILVLSAPVWAAAADAGPGGPKRPNVLLILSDDLTSMHLGCYGDPLAHTPNIDRLAARGVRFDKAYCQFPLCNPSRASFLTGLRPDTLRVYDLKTQFRQNVPNAQSVGQTFQKAGYHVMRVGKLYHYGVPLQIGTDGLDDAPSWAERYNPAGRDVKEDVPQIARTEFDPIEGKTVVKTNNEPNQFGGNLSWLAADGADDEQTDGKVAAKAIELLEANKDKPFFLGVGFFRPHTPFVAPRQYFGFYPLEKVPVWAEPAGWRASVPPIALIAKPDQDHMSADQKRLAAQAYFAATSFMDAQVGRVIDALDRLKLADNTVIVFASDHGYQLGEHNQWQKMTLFEDCARVPMIIASPGGARGATSPRVVELVDLHATLADLTGVPAPATDGVSLKPLVLAADAPWARPAVTQVTRVLPRGVLGGAGRNVMGYSVRTDRYRYTEWNGGAQGSELYDHDTDPHELKNLAADPAHAATVSSLKKLLPAKGAGRR
ncbi:MAG: arylsulfatase family protein [Phycisphaerales bacterium]|nr:arylsulfatase family protein [Phycisphaerales bacterium]